MDDFTPTNQVKPEDDFIPIKGDDFSPQGEDYGYGLRQDKTQKGRGFFGELKRPDSRISTEISIGVNINGKEIEIPTLVPTLNKAEIDYLLKGGKPTKEIVGKAVEHAKMRMSEGKSPFAEAGEQLFQPSTEDDFTPISYSDKRVEGEKEGWMSKLKKKVADVDRAMAGGETSEEEKQRWRDMGAFSKIIDVVFGRGGYAFKALAKEIDTEQQEIVDTIHKKYIPEEGVIMSTDTKKKMDNEIKKALLTKFPDIKSRLQAAYRGLTGKERRDWNSMLAEKGISGVPLLGFLYETSFDPFMWGGYSAISQGITKTAGGAAELAMKVPGIANVVEETKWALEPMAEMFKTKSKIPKLGEMVDKWLSGRHYLIGRQMRYAAQTRLAVRSIARSQGISPKEVGKRVANVMELRYYPDELARVVPNVSAEERVLANTLHSHYLSILSDEMKAGVNIHPLSWVRDQKIAKLQKNLNLLRTAYEKELSRTRAKLISDLEGLGDQRLAEYTKGLQGQQKEVEIKARLEHLQNVKKLDGAIDGVEKQMMGLEKLRNKPLQSPSIITDIDKQLAKLENQYWYLHSELADRLQDIPELAKGSIFTKQIDDISKLLASDIEVNLGKEGTSLAKKLISTEAKMGKLPQTELGVPVGESRKLLKQLTIERAKRQFGYVPRITTDEAKQIILSMRIGKSKLWTKDLVHALRRRTDDFTIEEFNEFVRAHGLESLDGKTIEQFFLTDPSYSLAVRGWKSAKAITSAEFLNESKMFGIPISKAPTTYRVLPDNVLRANPSLRGLRFPEEVANEIGRIHDFYLDPTYRPDVWGKFLKHFDNVQNLWKRWQLAVFPKYHIRNMVGNMWNNFLADVDPSTYPKATALQAYRKYRHTPWMGDVSRRTLRKLGISVDDAEQIIYDAERLGVLGGGWYSADIDLSIRQTIGKGGVTGRGMAVGQTLENNARLAHYLDRVGRGKTAEEAALSVKKYLFDYSDLTHFERGVMKRVMPFYSWTRKNIPLQLEHLIKTPQKFAPLTIPLRSREPSDLLRLKYADPQLYRSLPIELQRTIDTVTYIPLEGLLPAADLAKLGGPQNVIQDIVVELLSPFIKALIEQLTNTDLYRYKPIQSYAGETKPFLNADIPVRIRHLLTTISPASRITRELDKMVSKKKNKLPLTPEEWAVSSALSSVYKSDLGELKMRAVSNIRKMMKELEIGAYKAKREGREDEFKHIMDELNKNIKLMKGLL